MRKCSRCVSYAINPQHHGRLAGVDLDLCDVCYWRKRAEVQEADVIIAELEAKGLGWSLEHSCPIILVRIWRGMGVVGEYRPAHTEPLAVMLRGAIADMERNEVGK